MVNLVKWMMMEFYLEEKFLEVVKVVVKVNQEFVLLYGFGGIFYLCFFMVGIQLVVGVVLFNIYIFCVYVILVGVYVKGLNLVLFMVFKYDWVVYVGIG